MVPPGVAPQRGHDSDRQADEKRAGQRAASDHDIDRKTLPDDLVHGGVAVLIGRAEIALQNAAEIAKILFVQRLIQVILALDILFDLRRNFFLRIEWAAGSGVQQQKRQRDDDQHGGNGAQQPGNRVAKQVSSPGAPEYTCSATNCDPR